MRVPHRQTWPRWARALSSGWVVSPILVIALLAGAFVGYGAYTRSKPTHYARGGQFLAGATPSTGPSAANGPRRTGNKQHGRPSKPSPGIVAPAGAGTQPPVRTGNAGSGGHPGVPTSKPTKAPPRRQSSGVIVPHAGDYALAVSGDEHVSFGPFRACHNTFPSHAVLGIGHAAGESKSAFDFDLRLYPGDAGKHDERHIYRYNRSGVTLGFEQATVTCAGVRQSSTIDYKPPQQRVELPLTVGATWSSRGGDSARTEDTHSSVTGTSHVVISGVSYKVWIIDTTVTMSGSETGSRTQRWWYSPDLAMPVKWHEQLKGSRHGAKYSEDLTCTVVGLP